MKIAAVETCLKKARNVEPVYRAQLNGFEK